MINGCWLTINRACNIKCEWCYAQNAGYSSMPFKLLLQILDFLKELNVHSIMLIGGEPTVSDDLPQIIRECKKREFYTTLITNGLKLSNISYFNELVDAGIDNVSLSQKAYDKESYYRVTGVDAYDKVLEAINNLKNSSVKFSVSHVLTMNDIRFIPRVLEDEKKAGAKGYAFSFCYDFDSCQLSQKKPDNPYRMWDEFKNVYPDIDRITDGAISLQLSLPVCVTDKETLSQMIEKNQIRSVCQLLKRDGLIFDTDGFLIPCNAMYKYRLGRIGEDFCDKDSFLTFLESDKIVGFYNKVLALPDKTCKTCEELVNCGGGCIANWFNYSFKELNEMRKEVN